MPRYYFDIENGDPYRDEIGEDLSEIKPLGVLL
jgi:hypothetical protein